MKLERSSRTNHHQTRALEQVAHEAAAFIRREAGPNSLITVTRAISLAHGERMTVYISVFPEEKGLAALSFLERRRKAFSEHLKEHTRLRPLPRVDFMLDDQPFAKP